VTSRRSTSATTRIRSNASQEMQRKKTQNPRKSTAIDPKQTNTGIGTRCAIQRRKEKRVQTKVRRI
jgi:hypothetical protein